MKKKSTPRACLPPLCLSQAPRDVALSCGIKIIRWSVPTTTSHSSYSFTFVIVFWSGKYRRLENCNNWPTPVLSKSAAKNRPISKTTRSIERGCFMDKSEQGCSAFRRESWIVEGKGKTSCMEQESILVGLPQEKKRSSRLSIGYECYM